MSFSSVGTSGTSSIPPTFQWPVQVCLCTTITTYVLSILTGNVSQVDRLWTFLPVTYSAYWALLPYWPRKPLFFLCPYTPDGVHGDLVEEGNSRTRLMLLLQIIWMLRLSYNTWRRGLFSFKDEDYRWEILRMKVPKWLFQLINLVFISAIQNILLFLLALPTHNAAILSPEDRRIVLLDYGLAALSLAAIALEFVADNQQYSFQTYKRMGTHDLNDWWGARIKWTRADAQRGFVTRGLWAWSRHPNFFCEQLFWFLQAFFPILAAPWRGRLSQGELTPLVFLIPPLALSTLFFASTHFTESISSSKYPIAYRAYTRRVAMFVPLLTPLWGCLLALQGDKETCNNLVYGDEIEKKSD